jgi:hypothetical protein
MTVTSPALATVLAFAGLVALQAPPDFSGTWTMDLDRSESPHQGDGFEPPILVITQSATQVSIQSRRRAGVTTATYTITAPKAPDAVGPATGGRAFWDGAVLVTEGTRVVQGQTVSVRERRALDATGTEMSVETLVVVQHGYSFRGGQNFGASKDIYRRTPAPLLATY